MRPLLPAALAAILCSQLATAASTKQQQPDHQRQSGYWTWETSLASTESTASGGGGPPSPFKIQTGGGDKAKVYVSTVTVDRGYGAPAGSRRRLLHTPPPLPHEAATGATDAVGYGAAASGYSDRCGMPRPAKYIGRCAQFGEWTSRRFAVEYWYHNATGGHCAPDYSILCGVDRAAFGRIPLERHALGNAFGSVARCIEACVRPAAVVTHRPPVTPATFRPITPLVYGRPRPVTGGVRPAGSRYYGSYQYGQSTGGAYNTKTSTGFNTGRPYTRYTVPETGTGYYGASYGEYDKATGENRQNTHSGNGRTHSKWTVTDRIFGPPLSLQVYPATPGYSVGTGYGTTRATGETKVYASSTIGPEDKGSTEKSGYKVIPTSTPKEYEGSTAEYNVNTSTIPYNTWPVVPPATSKPVYPKYYKMPKMYNIYQLNLPKYGNNKNVPYRYGRDGKEGQFPLFAATGFTFSVKDEVIE